VWQSLAHKGGTKGIHNLRVLITGIAGFAGSHLAEYLLSNTDWQVWGTIHYNDDNIRHLRNQLHLRSIDLRDPKSTRNLLKDIAPQRVYHLAGQSHVPSSWDDPWQTFETNVRTQINVLEGSCVTDASTRVLVVASDQIYGQITPNELPLDEERPLHPTSPYAVSKAAQDMLGFQYHLNYGLHVVRARPFNHIGPRQRLGFVAPDFARQVAEIEAGLRPAIIKVGNLQARRDFTDVVDMVRAYYLALEHGQAGEAYNIGSGQAHSVQEVLDTLLELSSAHVTVEQDPARMRPSDVAVVVSDASKLQAHTGWRPEISLRETLRSVLDEWRARVGSAVAADAETAVS
jgi:GDP-4-dehydro-6-deoxy-D-mannose reductase